VPAGDSGRSHRYVRRRFGPDSEALAAATEAVAARQQQAAIRPDKFSLDPADALGTQSTELSRLHRNVEALSAAPRPATSSYGWQDAIMLT
jgi:hypothetical protein